MQPPNGKFASVPQDADTRIKSQRHISVAGIDALHQRWTWEGLSGESLIFCHADVPNATDQEIVALAEAEGFVTTDATFTVKRVDPGFVFLNFGFA